MNAKDYRLHLDGYQAAATGSGLSDSPHGGRDGVLWRGGVQAWLDENDQAADGRPQTQKTALQDGPGVAIPARPLS
jgi:hypothetical protein